MYVDSQHLPELENYLKAQGWLATDENITAAEKPGEGNMNYTLRIHTGARTFIVKQARPYVEKYPSIPAPVERAVMEGQFYQQTQVNAKLRAFMPQLCGMDAENSILVLEDLGISSDYTYLYQPNQTISHAEIANLMAFASELHHSFGNGSEVHFANRAMRALNHEHIFMFPLREENGFDLDNVQPGLQALASAYKRDSDLVQTIKNLGDIYLADGKHLLHGDFYPGSFLKTNAGVKIIDPEFCFYGPAEFDLGVLIAHCKMAQQPTEVLLAIEQHYQKPASFNRSLLMQFVGVEIIRRLIGIAQLPLSLSVEQKSVLLTEAKALVTGSQISSLSF